MRLKEEVEIARRKVRDPEWAQEFFDACVEEALYGEPHEYKLSRYLIGKVWGRKGLVDFKRALAGAAVSVR